MSLDSHCFSGVEVINGWPVVFTSIQTKTSITLAPVTADISICNTESSDLAVNLSGRTKVNYQKERYPRRCSGSEHGTRCSGSASEQPCTLVRNRENYSLFLAHNCNRHSHRRTPVSYSWSRGCGWRLWHGLPLWCVVYANIINTLFS